MIDQVLLETKSNQLILLLMNNIDEIVSKFFNIIAKNIVLTTKSDKCQLGLTIFYE